MIIYVTILCTIANLTIPFNCAVAITDYEISYYSMEQKKMVVEEITDSEHHLKYTVIYTKNAVIAFVKDKEIIVIEKGNRYVFKVKEIRNGIRNEI